MVVKDLFYTLLSFPEQIQRFASFRYCLLKTYSPTRQMPTPISLCGVIGS